MTDLLRLKSGFSLLEMLVVMTVIVLLTAIALPAINKVREMSKRTQCLSNLQQIGTVMRLYSTDNDGRFLTAYDGSSTWDRVLVARGLIGKKQLVCPADTARRTIPGDPRSYAYNGYFGDPKVSQPNTVEGYATRVSKPLSDIVMLADRGHAVAVINATSLMTAYAHTDCLSNHKKGSNYVFADLHAEWSVDTGTYSSSPESYNLWLKHWRCDLP